MSIAVAALVALLPARARAQLRLGPIAVDAEREPDDAPDADAPPFVTIIDAKRASARVASVADLVESEAGIQLRSQGGLGAFTSVSIRGSDPNEVAVFIDGVPLNRAAAATVDLSQLPVDGLERIEIYRGVPPLEFGSDVVGGAINLVTRKGRAGEHYRASVGGGSFGTRSASVGYSTGGPVHADVSAAYHGTQGDFTYYDYGGTQLDTSDDRVSRRQNNGFDQLSLDATVGGESGPTRWSLGAHGFGKRQGVPGPGYADAPSLTARLDTERLVIDGSAERTGLIGRSVDGRVDLYAVWERSAFDPGDGARGAGYLVGRTDNQTLAAGARGRLAAAASAHELFTILGSVDAERFWPRDLRNLAEDPGPSTRVRAGLAVGDEIRLARDRVALSPAVRLDAVVSSLAPGLDVRGAQQTGSSSATAFASPRLGARVRVTDWLALKGNVGWFQRVPTTLELFGDGGAFMLPHPSLQPERSVSGDVGARLAIERAQGAASLEGTFFGREVHGFIILSPRGNALEAINLPDDPPVHVLGAEAIFRARLGRALSVGADYTLLQSSNGGGGQLADADGKQLPYVPRHRLSARAQLAFGPFSAGYEVLYTSDAWRDMANTDGALIPARALHSISASAGPFGRLGITLAIEIRNLADLRVVPLPLGGTTHAGETTPYPLADLFDYPLPGRALYATLTAHN